MISLASTGFAQLIVPALIRLVRLV
jgi:hypothetical protein